jgi:aspartyl-tRNA(Asn)/glutamyl-tRNA(Gln) amidotransferase subunit A
VELVTEILRRIRALDSELHAFVTVTEDRAIADARAAETILGRGVPSDPLVGIPVGYKDVLATRGIRTTAGSALLESWVPDADAAAVTRLQRVGTVMLGKLMTHEFALGIQPADHPFQAARNPWNLAYSPGGSSSGPAAAVAAGLVFGAVATDTAGSIRGPAASCGIVGLKPTYGRVGRTGVVPLSWSLDHVGPMARTVEDCAYLLQAIAGVDPADHTSHREPADDYLAGLSQGIHGLRIGVIREHFLDGIDPEAESAFEEALEVLRRLGAMVKDVTVPNISRTPAYMAILLSEAFTYHERTLRETPHLYGDVVRAHLQAGALFTAHEYLQAQRLRSQLFHEMMEVLHDVNVLATPTASSPPPSLASARDPDFVSPKSNRAPFNLTGLPTLAIPNGFSSVGLPWSLQITGRPFDEAMVLRVGYAYEQTTDWHLRRPAVR